MNLYYGIINSILYIIKDQIFNGNISRGKSYINFLLKTRKISYQTDLENCKYMKWKLKATQDDADIT